VGRGFILWQWQWKVEVEKFEKFPLKAMLKGVWWIYQVRQV